MIDNNASMQNQAYEIIKNKILTAAYYPGQRVSEKMLSPISASDEPLSGRPSSIFAGII